MYNALEDLFTLEDSILKINDLVTGLRDRYEFSAGERPTRETLSKPNILAGLAEDEASNTRVWICHYETIMRRLDMIDDYVITCSKVVSAAIKSVNAAEQEEAASC